MFCKDICLRYFQVIYYLLIIIMTKNSFGFGWLKQEFDSLSKVHNQFFTQYNNNKFFITT